MFCWKNVSSFCSAKATHIFSAKNFRKLYIESAKTVSEMTLNELVKLTTLWTTGPRMLNGWRPTAISIIHTFVLLRHYFGERKWYFAGIQAISCRYLSVCQKLSEYYQRFKRNDHSRLLTMDGRRTIQDDYMPLLESQPTSVGRHFLLIVQFSKLNAVCFTFI